MVVAVGCRFLGKVAVRDRREGESGMFLAVEKKSQWKATRLLSRLIQLSHDLTTVAARVKVTPTSLTSSAHSPLSRTVLRLQPLFLHRICVCECFFAAQSLSCRTPVRNIVVSIGVTHRDVCMF